MYILCFFSLFVLMFVCIVNVISQVKLMCTAEGSPSELFQMTHSVNTSRDETRLLMDDLQISQVREEEKREEKEEDQREKEERRER